MQKHTFQARWKFTRNMSNMNQAVGKIQDFLDNFSSKTSYYERNINYFKSTINMIDKIYSHDVLSQISMMWTIFIFYASSWHIFHPAFWLQIK